MSELAVIIFALAFGAVFVVSCALLIWGTYHAVRNLSERNAKQ